MNRFRRFLARLNYDGIERAEVPRLFSEAELQSETVKWLKRLLLVRVGLSTYNILKTDIHRFPLYKLDLAERTCRSIAETALSRGKEFLIVVKVIPSNSLGQIPNFRLYSPRDVPTVFEAINREIKKGENQELWFCLSLADKNTLSLGGRILIGRHDIQSVIEMIWYTSPRMIEEVNTEQCTYPFWRGRRSLSEMGYKTEAWALPRHMAGKQKQLLQECQIILKQIYEKRESIDDFCSLLFRSGVNTVSLEFRVNAGNLAFIDWDTDIDY